MEHSVEEYLNKQGIEEFDKLAQHIMELKRNTKPNVALISELADILINKKDIKISPLGHIDLSNLVSLTLDKEAVGKNGNLLETGFASTRHKSRGGETHIIFDMLDNEMDDKETEGVADFKKKYPKDGVKHNNGKPQISLLFKQFPKALEAIAKCSEYGHEKYKEADQDYLNYQRVEGGSKAFADAGLRHRLFKEGTTDLDSQLPHAYHTCWNALAELELILMKR